MNAVQYFSVAALQVVASKNFLRYKGVPMDMGCQSRLAYPRVYLAVLSQTFSICNDPQGHMVRCVHRMEKLSRGRHVQELRSN